MDTMNRAKMASGHVAYSLSNERLIVSAAAPDHVRTKEQQALGPYLRGNESCILFCPEGFRAEMMKF